MVLGKKRSIGKSSVRRPVLTKKLTGSAEDEKREENRHIPVSRNRDSEATAAASCDILFCSDSLTKNETEDIKNGQASFHFFGA